MAALNLTRAHPLSRAVYNCVAIYLITEAHCGYDLPCMLHRLLPGRVMGPVLHQLHHERGDCNFGKFLTVWDAAAGTLIAPRVGSCQPHQPRAGRRAAAALGSSGAVRRAGDLARR